MELTMRPLIVSALCRKHTYSKLYLPQHRTLTVYFWPCLQCTISRICLRYNVFVQTKLNCIYYLSITHMVLYTHYKASKHQVSTFSLLNIPLLVCKRVCLRFFFFRWFLYVTEAWSFSSNYCLVFFEMCDSLFLLSLCVRRFLYSILAKRKPINLRRSGKGKHQIYTHSM